MDWMEAAAIAFADRCVDDLRTAGLLRVIKEVDHICYRVASLDRYQELKEELGSLGRLLSEATVNGRPIASFKLYKPFKLNSGFAIGVFELPSPKSTVDYPEGYEHIEVVTRLSLQDVLKEFPGLDFDTRHIHHPTNADITRRFSVGLVKFHERSLEEVIAEEQRNTFQ